MTRQEIFNKVATHLLTQNKKAMRPSVMGSGCVYKTDAGLRCAIGCLIPDEHPGLDFDGDVGELVLAHGDLKELFDWRNNVVLLEALQVVHDEQQPSTWILDLEAEAVNHGLSPRVLKDHRNA